MIINQTVMMTRTTVLRRLRTKRSRNGRETAEFGHPKIEPFLVLCVSSGNVPQLPNLAQRLTNSNRDVNARAAPSGSHFEGPDGAYLAVAPLMSAKCAGKLVGFNAPWPLRAARLSWCGAHSNGWSG